MHVSDQMREIENGFVIMHRQSATVMHTVVVTGRKDEQEQHRLLLEIDGCYQLLSAEETAYFLAQVALLFPSGWRPPTPHEQDIVQAVAWCVVQKRGVTVQFWLSQLVWRFALLNRMTAIPSAGGKRW
jgi:hypothetical protein